MLVTACKWRHLVGKFASNVSGAMLLLNLMEVTESISGSVVPLAMFDLGKGGWANAYKK